MVATVGVAALFGAGLVGLAPSAEAAKPLKLRVYNVKVTEGTGGTVVAAFAARLSRKAPRDLTFTWSTRSGSTSAAKGDFKKVSGAKAKIKKGSTFAILSVKVNADDIDEFAETFKVHVSNASSGVKIADANAVATIVDDDRPPKLKVVSADIVEGTDAGGALMRKISVTLSRPSGKKLSARYTVKERKAKIPADLLGDRGTVTFKPGRTSKKAFVRVVADAKDEADEGFGIKWDQAVRVRLPASNTDAMIIDDDDPTNAQILGSTPLSPSQDAMPTIFGVAPVKSTVNVYLNASCTGAPVTSGTAADFGGSGITVPVTPNETNTLTVKGTDTVGGADTNCSDPFTYTHDDIVPEAPMALASVPVSPTNVANPTVRGTAEVGTTVRVFVDDSTCTGTAVATVGAAAFDDPAGVSPGALTPNVNHAIRFTATDDAGNVSDCSEPLALLIDTIDPVEPTGLIVLPAAVTSDTTPSLQGNAETGSTVRVLVGSCPGGVVTEGTAAQFGSASGIEVSPALVEGTYDLFARAVDAAGNVGPCAGPVAVTVDTTAPAAPTGLVLETSSPTANPVARVSGDAENGSTVTLYRDTAATGGCNVEVGSGPVSAFRGAGISTSALPDGAHTLRATATDGFGREGPCSTTAATVVVDATAPVAPTGLALVGSSPTSDRTPLVTGNAEAGSTVTLFEDDGDGGTACDTSLGSGSQLAFSGAGLATSSLADGPHIIHARASDGLQQGPCSASFVTVVVDGTRPAPPVLEAIADGGPGDYVAKGSAETGSTVRVYLNGSCAGAPVDSLGAGAFGGAGAALGFLGANSYSVSAEAEDAVGNVSNCSTAVNFIVT